MSLIIYMSSVCAGLWLETNPELQDMQLQAAALNQRMSSSAIAGVNVDVSIADSAGADRATNGGQLAPVAPVAKECPNRIALEDAHFAVSESLVDSARAKHIGGNGSWLDESHSRFQSAFGHMVEVSNANHIPASNPLLDIWWRSAMIAKLMTTTHLPLIVKVFFHRGFAKTQFQTSFTSYKSSRRIC